MSGKVEPRAGSKSSRARSPAHAQDLMTAAHRQESKPFILLEDGPLPGVHARTRKGKYEHLCGVLKPLGRAVDADGRVIGYRVGLENQHRRRKVVTIPPTHLTPQKLHAFLSAQGLSISLFRAELLGPALYEYLYVMGPEKSYPTVEGGGWHMISGPKGTEPVAVYALGDQVFQRGTSQNKAVRPHHVVGAKPPQADEVLTTLLHSIANDSLAIFTVCVAAAAIVLRPLRHNTCLMFFVGRSSVGKSTLLKFANSLYGEARMLTWQATRNGVGAAMQSFQDRVCVMDEVGQGTGKVFADATYDLTNNSSKLRATSSGGLAAAFASVNVVLSAGEESPQALIQRSTGNVSDGQRARLLTIPVQEPHGVWSTLGDYRDGAAKSEAVLQLATVCSGTFIARFAQAVVDEVREMADDFALHTDSLEQELCKDLDLQGDPVARRVLKDFVVFLYAGLVARDAQVVPWRRAQIVNAVQYAFALWHREYLRERPVTGDVALQHLTLFFQSRRGHQFPPLADYARDHAGTIAGYEHTFKGEPDSCFLVLPAFFKQELCKGMDHRTALDALKSQGFLRPGPRNSMTTQVHLPGTPGEHRTFYAVRRAILAA